MHPLLSHFIAAILVASLVTMVMLARPLLWFRRFLHHITCWGDSSWGKCGYCLSFPTTVLVVLVLDLHWEELLRPTWRNVCLGHCLSTLLIYLLAVYIHMGYMRLTDRTIEYPPLDGDSSK